MTTVYKHKLLMMSFQGRSPRQIYIDSCEEHGVRVQRSLCDELSNSTDDFGRLQHLICSGIAFGVRGCLALVPVIQCSRNLRRVDLKGCGVTDEFVAHLVEALQEHPTIRTIDLSDNAFITVHSGKGLVKMAELNPNIVACDVSNTHVGVNVAKVVSARCEANRFRLVSYFADDFFRMKDLFNSVDADGSGWVHIKNIVGSVNAPILQERLIERIALKRSKKRSDNCIHVNTFMELVYLNYKSMSEIHERASDATDPVALAVKTNWKLLIQAMRAHGVTCAGLSKFRVRDLVLSRSEAEELVLQAVEYAGISSGSARVSPRAANVVPDDKKFAPTPPQEAAAPPSAAETVSGNNEVQLDEQPGEEGTAAAEQSEAPHAAAAVATPPPAAADIEISPKDLMVAFKQLFPPLPPAPKSFGFLKERGDDYVSPLLRQGSRCVSITDMSSNATPALSQLGEDDDDPVHSWRTPPTMVREIVKIFLPTYQPHSLMLEGNTGLRSASSINQAPALPQKDLLIDQILDATPGTELEYIRIAGLCAKFAQYSIPTDVSTITLQEVVNVVDECYDVIRVDRPFTVAQIEKMCGL
ncbi:Hypothetical protein, putative [Bodo saltans]|uniref:Leucine-rich repeat protein n=1 Tax=Bodo saltans TaxID=75058 RepID=A0A0S4JJW4_BODSA|nr:Hypothetical protein, putative [Bodo saltans]|eukprot:CUG90856.1 Hypothetical protein, putative [Bodo saltans]